MGRRKNRPLLPLPVSEGVEFRHVEGWPGYCVSDTGKVLSCRSKNGHGFSATWKELKLRLVKDYLRVKLCNGKRWARVPVHVLVLTAFHGPRPPGMVSRHTPDHTTTNNHATNLKWGTTQDNANDRVAMGRSCGSHPGSAHHFAKLTETSVLDMRRRYAKGDVTVTVLAREAGVHYVTAFDAIKRRTWRHIA